jgi:hypothetical protein
VLERGNERGRKETRTKANETSESNRTVKLAASARERERERTFKRQVQVRVMKRAHEEQMVEEVGVCRSVDRRLGTGESVGKGRP